MLSRPRCLRMLRDSKTVVTICAACGLALGGCAREPTAAAEAPAGPSAATLEFLVTLREDAVRANYLALLDGAWGVLGNGMRGLPGQSTGVQMSMTSMRDRLTGADRNVDPNLLAFFWAQMPGFWADRASREKFQTRLRGWFGDTLAHPLGTPEQDLDALELEVYALMSIIREQAALLQIRKMSKELCEYLRASYAQGDLMVEEFRRPGDQDYRLNEAKAIFETEYLGDGPAKPGTIPLTRGSSIEEFKELLDQGARLHDQDAARVLIRACNLGQPFTVRYLLHRGVEANARIRVSTSGWDYDPGSTALFEVVKWHGPLNRMIAKNLIDKGAHGRVETDWGETPMSIALRSRIRDPEVLQMIQESCEGDQPPLVYHGSPGAVEVRRSGFPWHKQLVSNTVYDAVLEPKEGKGPEKRRLRFVLDWEWQTRRAHGILRWNDTGTVTAIKASVGKKGGLSITEIGLVARPDASRNRYRPESWTMQEREDGPGLAFRCTYNKWQRIELTPSGDGSARGELPHTPKTWVSESSTVGPAIRKDGIYAAEGGRGVTYVRFSTGGLVMLMTRRLSDDMEFESAAAEDVQWILAGQKRLRHKTAWARSRGNRLSYAIYTRNSPLSPSTIHPRVWVFGEVHSNGDLTLREIDLSNGSVEERRYRFVPLSQDR